MTPVIMKNQIPFSQQCENFFAVPVPAAVPKTLKNRFRFGSRFQAVGSGSVFGPIFLGTAVPYI